MHGLDKDNVMEEGSENRPCIRIIKRMRKGFMGSGGWDILRNGVS